MHLYLSTACRGLNYSHHGCTVCTLQLTMDYYVSYNIKTLIYIYTADIPFCKILLIHPSIFSLSYFYTVCCDVSKLAPCCLSVTSVDILVKLFKYSLSVTLVFFCSNKLHLSSPPFYIVKINVAS